MYLSADQLILPNLNHLAPRVILQSVHERGSSDINEDVLLETEDTFGVFDGATSLDAKRYDGWKTGGYLAAHIAAETFRYDKRELFRVAREANDRIRDAQVRERDHTYDRHQLWSTSLAVVRIHESRLEFCQSGDSVILLLLENGDYQLIGSEVDIDRETLTMWKEMAWREGLTIHEALADKIREVRQGMNIDYGVLNGEPDAMRFLRHGEIERDKVREILLLTDGLNLPREEPAQDHDWQEFIDLYRRKGLHGLHRRVRALQKTDPHCRMFPRFKQHDDIAAMALTF